MTSSKTKIFQHRGERFKAFFIERPFREGIEMRFELNGAICSVAELGLGQRALIEKAKSIIDRAASQAKKPGNFGYLAADKGNE